MLKNKQKRISDTIDILASEREKLIVNAVISLAKRKLGKIADKEKIHEYMMKQNNPVVKDILYWAYKASNSINARRKGDLWQQRNIVEKTEFVLWVLLHHKKYRQLINPLITSLFNKTTKIEFDKKDTLKFFDSALISMMLKYAYKELNKGFTFHQLMDETTTGTNTAIWYIQNKIQEIIKSTIGNENEQRMLCDMVAFGLWFCQHDTAYRDVFFWIVYHIGNKELREAVKPYYLPPSKWYVNLYLLGQEEGRALRAKGEMGRFQHSMLGEMAVPGLRQRHVQKIMDEKLRK